MLRLVAESKVTGYSHSFIILLLIQHGKLLYFMHKNLCLGEAIGLLCTYLLLTYTLSFLI